MVAAVPQSPYLYEAITESPLAHEMLAEDSEASEGEGVAMLPSMRPLQASWRKRVLATLALMMAATAMVFLALPAFADSSVRQRNLPPFADNSGLRGGLVSLVGRPVEATASGTATSSSSEGDIRIRVFRNEDCDTFHPHGLVHEYTASLNKCDTVTEEGETQNNGKYQITGTTNETLSEGLVLTPNHCGGNVSALVHHHPFMLTIGKFTDCCSFTHGGCGFKCITFAVNEVPPEYGGEGMDGGDIRIKVCRNEDCDNLHPHGLVHEYTAELNTCAPIPEDDAKETNGKYEITAITDATASALADGTMLTARHCGNETAPVKHDAFSLVVGRFTDCCSFRQGGCGFKCITFKQNHERPGNESLENKSNTTVPNITLAASNTTVPSTTFVMPA